MFSTRWKPTSADAAVSTIAIHRDIFEKAGLTEAFARTIAFVVQPGVEFGSDNVIQYDPAKAARLAKVLDNDEMLVFEAHSTDYQPEAALSALVRDGFPILKVGPGVTFAYREALYALDLIATELVPGYGERPLFHAMEDVMTAHPKDWQGHYHGDERALRLQRHYSLQRPDPLLLEQAAGGSRGRYASESIDRCGDPGKPCSISIFRNLIPGTSATFPLKTF